MSNLPQTQSGSYLKFCFFFSDLSYEKAYCEYRLNRVWDANNTLKGITENTERVQELQAQIVSLHVLQPLD